MFKKEYVTFLQEQVKYKSERNMIHVAQLQICDSRGNKVAKEGLKKSISYWR